MWHSQDPNIFRNIQEHFRSTCRQVGFLGVGLLTPGLPVQIYSTELQNKIVPSDFPREIVHIILLCPWIPHDPKS